MPITISNNVLAPILERQLDNATADVARSAERLASGHRINRGSDDPSGAAISGHLDAEIHSTDQARKNAIDAQSLAQVAQGGLNQVGDLLLRLRELAIQSASDTIGDSERALLQDEAAELESEVNRIALSTQFRGKSLLDGSSPDLSFQIGTDSKEMSRIVFPASQLDARASTLGVGEVDVSDEDSAREAIDTIDEAFDRLNPLRARLGAFQSRMESVDQTLAIAGENLRAAQSRVSDTDFAEEASKWVSAQIRQRAAVAVLAQANQTPEQVLKLITG